MSLAYNLHLLQSIQFTTLPQSSTSTPLSVYSTYNPTPPPSFKVSLSPKFNLAVIIHIPFQSIHMDVPKIRYCSKDTPSSQKDVIVKKDNRRRVWHGPQKQIRACCPTDCSEPTKPAYNITLRHYI